MRGNLGIVLTGLLLVAGVGSLTLGKSTEENRVALPGIVDATVAPRVVYIENPRFPKLTTNDLRQTLQVAADLVKDHFGIRVLLPEQIAVLNIDTVFTDLVGSKPIGFDKLIGDFQHVEVDWELVRTNLKKQIRQQKDPLAQQIEFARPHLIRPLTADDLDSFSQAVVETFKTRLLHWTQATLADGHPVIGQIPGRPALPLNEYRYWSLMAKQGIEADIILTNQLVASVEYLPLPLHTSIRGGITGGSTDYNPSSPLGSSVWVSLFPYFSSDSLIRELRNSDGYTREEALTYAGTMLAHELGHQLLQLGHPWSNRSCLMRPVELLDFVSWFNEIDAGKCPLGSSPAMEPGAVKVPVW